MDKVKPLCLSCGAQLKGTYCHHCGEKMLVEEDRSVKRWINDLFSNIWMLDGKFLRSFRLLIFKPGKYAKDYMDGIRKPYLKPLNLFLIANLIYFLSPSFNTFQTSLNSQMHNLPYSGLIENVVNNRVDNGGKTLSELQVLYNEKTGEVSKLILIILAPLMGSLYYLLFQRKGLRLSDGFNLALQFWAFFLFIFLIFLPHLSSLSNYLFGFPFFRTELMVSISALTLSGVYMFFQFKTVVKEKAWNLMGKLLLIILSFLPQVFIYRFILFWVTYWLV